jgi:hypothetical protein
VYPIKLPHRAKSVALPIGVQLRLQDAEVFVERLGTATGGQPKQTCALALVVALQCEFAGVEIGLADLDFLGAEVRIVCGRDSAIDSEQMIIRIVQSKGGKDRHVLLPNEALDPLRQWWKARPTTSEADGRGPSHRLFSAHSSAILPHMKVEEIAEAVSKLPPDQLARFRRWFTAFEAGRTDHAEEFNSAVTKLGRLAGRAFADLKRRANRD